MIRSFRAELARLTRRRIVLFSIIAGIVIGVGGAAIVLAAAKPAGTVGAFAPTVDKLSAAGGGTEIFRFAAAYGGTLVFVLFVGLTAVEFSRGTIRTMLLRQPQRVRLLAGKLLAMLTFVAVLLVFTEAVMWLAARVQASGAGVSTDKWTSLSALGSAFSDLGIVLIWVIGYAVLGTAVAVLLRSVPLALAVGIAWAGPFEHLMQDAWSPAVKVFPGLLLEIIGEGGTPAVSMSRALLTVAGYVLVAATATGIVFSRRDVSA